MTKFLLVLIALVLLVGMAHGQVPQAPTRCECVQGGSCVCVLGCSCESRWEWQTLNDDQAALFCNGVQVGGYRYSEGKYYPRFAVGVWGEACQSPVAVPARASVMRPMPLPLPQPYQTILGGQCINGSCSSGR